MRNKTITYSLLGLIILLFTVYFLVQNAFFPSGHAIVDELNNIIQCAQQEKWTEAERAAGNLKKIWDKEKYFLALNYAEADYSLFLDNISRIQAAINTKNDTETIIHAQSALKLWINFTKIIPQP